MFPHAHSPFAKIILTFSMVYWSGFLLLNASQITWRSVANQPHLTSSGAALTTDFIFELGAFNVGFTPTATNTGQWASDWHMASRVAFNVTSSLFTSSHTVTSNAAPFTTSNQGYIWGYNANANGSPSEWILITNPSWKWPSAGGVGFPKTWATFTASTTIVGALGGEGDAFHLQTAAVPAPPPVLSQESWREGFFSPAQLADDTVSGWLADPDNDGHNNAFEYALGGDPLVYSSDLDLVVTSLNDGSGNVQVDLLRVATRLATVDLEVSYNLNAWFDELDPLMMVTQDGSDMLQIQFQPTVLPRVFLRMSAQLLGNP